MGYRENIMNSQASIMDESDLNFGDEQVNEFKNKNGPKRKRRKLDMSQKNVEEEEEEEDDANSNAVIDSLLGMGLSASSDGENDDIDMGMLGRKKKKKNLDDSLNDNLMISQASSIPIVDLSQDDHSVPDTQTQNRRRRPRRKVNGFGSLRRST